jgi:predicted metal-dependent enzyme (double-stranded beta helix superfamily)
MTTDLTDALARAIGDETFASAMARVAARFASYRERLPTVPYAYSRTRLAATPDYEIVAMNWAPQSTSPIHDHGASRCWVLMLDGVLDVRNYTCGDDGEPVDGALAAIDESDRIVLHAGDIDHRLGPAELHRVRNPSTATSAFSLQLYARPLATYSIVDARSHVRRIVTATCELELILD